MNKFIKLTDESGDEVYVNPVMIESMTSKNNNTWIRLMSGHVKVVAETIDQIIKIIDRTNYYKF